MPKRNICLWVFVFLSLIICFLFSKEYFDIYAVNKTQIIPLSDSNHTINEIPLNEKNNSTEKQMYDESSFNMMSVFSSLAGAFGGAIAGGLISSIVSALLSRRHTREKDHLSDLKKDIINPLIEIMSNYTLHINIPVINDSISLIEPNYGLESYDFKNIFYYNQKNSDIELKSDNFLFQDLINNHYPNIESKLKSMLKITNLVGNSYHRLLDKMEQNLESLKNIEINNQYENYEKSWLGTLKSYITNREYNSSFLRITTYGKYRYLYISDIENSLRSFGYGKTRYQIYGSTYEDQKKNVENVEFYRQKIGNIIDKMINEIKNELNDYYTNTDGFEEANKELLNNLLKIKYSTKLNFIKNNDTKKKCTLT
jgi:hypothetical protein